MLEKQIKELKQVSSILKGTKEIGTLKQKSKLIKLYLKSINKINVYSLIMDATLMNLSLEEQIKIIENVNCSDELEFDNLYILLNDYIFKENSEENKEIIELYLNSCDKEKMKKLLSNPFYMMFRTNKEKIELSTIYEEILKTENYLAMIKGIQNDENVSNTVYKMLTNVEDLIKEDFSCEVQKQQIYDYLKFINFNIINFEKENNKVYIK